ncbi:RNA-binding protein [bacterium]|nr:RNA-binding protein [bacterium]
MPFKVFVGNLPFSVDNQRLQSEFSRFGSVESARVVTDRHTGRSRGYGFVEFSDESSANAAIAGLNSQPMDGRPLTVSMAKAKE